MKETLARLGLLWTLAAPVAGDPRSDELVRLECSSRLGRREATLFANGTVRSRVWDAEGALDMKLAELPPEELVAYRQRLTTEAAGTGASEAPAAEGEWLEACSLTLTLPDAASRTFRFARLDTLPLALGRLVAVAEELFVVADERQAVESLPADYEAQRGDVLLGRDGLRYQVQGLTSDGRAVELLGLDQPFTVYVALASLRGEFRRVVTRP